MKPSWMKTETTVYRSAVTSHLEPHRNLSKSLRNTAESLSTDLVQLDALCIDIANKSIYVRFEAFMAVTMKNGVFWDVMPCGSCKNRRFGGT
jgi:hypothetical protein